MAVVLCCVCVVKMCGGVMGEWIVGCVGDGLVGD